MLPVLLLKVLRYILFESLIAPDNMKIKTYDIKIVDLGKEPIISQSRKIKIVMPNTKKLAVRALNKATSSLVLT
jgi:hypothetical protein